MSSASKLIYYQTGLLLDSSLMRSPSQQNLTTMKNSLCYHQHVPSPDHPRVQGLDNINVYQYSSVITSHAVVQELCQRWKDNLRDVFYGITSDGVRREGLYGLQDEQAPTARAARIARTILDGFTYEQRSRAYFDLQNENWRKWSNPEFVIFDVGVRLETLETPQISSIMDLLEVSLGETGFAKARGAMKLNKFLGEICSSRAILNENCYFFFISGYPSETDPWKFTFFGHHLCLSIAFLGGQMTVSPVFIGAEPNIIDSGPDCGIELFKGEAEYGLRLFQSLDEHLRKRAQIYADLHDARMPEERWNAADQRHLAGAFQDNRVIPYEGVVAAQMSFDQRINLLKAVRAFLCILPPSALEHRMRQIEEHLHETYFSWIGGFGADDAFYYRIQSPVVILEFDHHSGVFLTNKAPAKYHIHTIIRTPNGNDYGCALVELWRRRASAKV